MSKVDFLVPAVEYHKIMIPAYHQEEHFRAPETVRDVIIGIPIVKSSLQTLIVGSAAAGAAFLIARLF